LQHNLGSKIDQHVGTEKGANAAAAPQSMVPAAAPTSHGVAPGACYKRSYWFRATSSIGEKAVITFRRTRQKIAKLIAPGAMFPTQSKSSEVVYDGDGLRLSGKNLAALSDPAFRQAYDRSGASQIEFRAYVCCWAAEQASKIVGDFVECGVNEGRLSLTICQYLNFNKLDKSFFLFDTFHGIPSQQITDEERPRALRHQYVECYETTLARFKPFPKVQLVRGIVPDSLKMVQIDRVSYLSIDMNIEKPERAAIEYFWPKLSSGAVIVMDDYAFAGYDAQHRSMDDFARRVGVPILTMPTGQGLLIKR
jgi:O-methyltransferase